MSRMLQALKQLSVRTDLLPTTAVEPFSAEERASFLGHSERSAAETLAHLQQPTLDLQPSPSALMATFAVVPTKRAAPVTLPPTKPIAAEASATWLDQANPFTDVSQQSLANSTAEAHHLVPKTAHELDIVPEPEDAHRTDEQTPPAPAPRFAEPTGEFLKQIEAVLARAEQLASRAEQLTEPVESAALRAESAAQRVESYIAPVETAATRAEHAAAAVEGLVPVLNDQRENLDKLAIRASQATSWAERSVETCRLHAENSARQARAAQQCVETADEIAKRAQAAASEVQQLTETIFQNSTQEPHEPLAIVQGEKPIGISRGRGLRAHVASYQPISVSTAIAELRNKILANRRVPLQSLALVAASPADDNTHTILELAKSLVGTVEGEVLVIDADPESLPVARRLGLPESPGLHEVLGGTHALEDGVVSSAYAGISLLPLGDRTAAPSADAGSAFQSLLAQATQRFGMVLVSAGEVRHLHTIAVAQHCDAVYLGVQLGGTSRVAALDTLAALQQAGAKVLGSYLYGA